jgi:gluconolactonase
MNDMSVSRRGVLAGMAGAAALPFVASSAAAETVGKIEKFDAGLDAVIDVNSPIEVLGKGYKWAEGPVWMKAGKFLLFTDVPANVMYVWNRSGVFPYMTPSGLKGKIPDEIREAGANGLAVDRKGNLFMADSGSRAIFSVNPLGKTKTLVADKYEGKRFNSCNDLVINKGGTIYFTDPPYGLKDGDTSPIKELDFNGVFRRTPDGQIHLVDKLHRPNGIALSPDQRRLYVAMSDENRPEILVYDLDIAGGASSEGRVFASMKTQLDAKLPGLPDGLKVDKAGRVFATGPGGVHIYSPTGTLLGTVSTGKATANCAFGGEDGRSLFLTSSDMLCRVKLKTAGI